MSFNSHRGTLYIRVGPMFSGKTTWLNGELTQLADKNFSVLKIIHSSDTRNDVSSNDYSGSTHNSSYKFLTPKITIIRDNNLSNIDVSTINPMRGGANDKLKVLPKRKRYLDKNNNNEQLFLIFCV